MRAWLLNLPVAIGMVRITPVVVEEPLPGVVAGLVLLAESHCSAHWYGERLYLDCFSCKPFDWQQVTEMAVREFRLTAWEPRCLEARLDLTRREAG